MANDLEEIKIRQHANEIAKGKRFEFGKNWNKFLEVLNDERIEEAENSLKRMLEIEDLKDKSFLDIGSGSGLFSLAARRLGARVYSFDYDPQSVACTGELKRRYFPDDASWTVEEGSVLDAEYLKTLGKFDIVYSWGVLHHTGDMWKAIETTLIPVKAGGKLFIAIYNNQGWASHYWTIIKRIYNRLPAGFKFFVLLPVFIRLWGPTMLRDLLQGKPFHTWHSYKRSRGMSPWRNVVDWVGGYPFEVAKPDDIFDFYRNKGFILTKLKTCGGGHGNNEFVFERT